MFAAGAGVTLPPGAGVVASAAASGRARPEGGEEVAAEDGQPSVQELAAAQAVAGQGADEVVTIDEVAGRPQTPFVQETRSIVARPAPAAADATTPEEARKTERKIVSNSHGTNRLTPRDVMVATSIDDVAIFARKFDGRCKYSLILTNTGKKRQLRLINPNDGLHMQLELAGEVSLASGYLTIDKGNLIFDGESVQRNTRLYAPAGRNLANLSEFLLMFPNDTGLVLHISSLTDYDHRRRPFEFTVEDLAKEKRLMTRNHGVPVFVSRGSDDLVSILKIFAREFAYNDPERQIFSLAMLNIGGGRYEVRVSSRMAYTGLVEDGERGQVVFLGRARLESEMPSFEHEPVEIEIKNGLSTTGFEIVPSLERELGAGSKIRVQGPK